jgi:TatD DNase family protein
MALTDSHAHLSQVAEELGAEALASVLESYAASWEEAGRAHRSGPLLVDIGTESGDLADRTSLFGKGLPFLRLSAGIWPSAESLSKPAEGVAALAAAIGAAEKAGFHVSAIGEGGLDYHHMEGSKEAQAELFEAQLALAAALGLPIIVHSRDAASETLALVARAPRSADVIIHCFGYGAAEARAFLDSGCLISFAGNLTYKGSAPLREACALVPAERLLLETDSPYMNPMPRRGSRSTPLDIARTYAVAAELRGVAPEDLAETVALNARRVFG